MTNTSKTRLPVPRPDWALFFDLDGTLIEIAEHPERARPSSALPGILQQLRTTLGGALVLVSGRSIASIDRLVDCPHLAVAGLHGLERRLANGQWCERAERDPALDTAKRRLQALAARYPGVYIEDKRAALAAHYRQAPQAAKALRREIEALHDILGSDFELLHGKSVFELKLGAADKGRVVERFMAEAPFAGRQPVFVGDDITDEDGFKTAKALGGLAICVGTRRKTAATWRAASVEEMLVWLEEVPRTLAAQTGR